MKTSSARRQKAAFLAMAAALSAAAIAVLRKRRAADWEKMLVEEHHRLAELLDRLQDIDADKVRSRKSTLRKVERLLNRHATKEEAVIYPIIPLGDVCSGAGNPFADHAELKRLLNILNHMDPAAATFDAEVRSLRRLLDEHMADEEQKLFPALKSSRDDEENYRITCELRNLPY